MDSPKLTGMLGMDSSFEGTIHFQGCLRIDGTVKGEIQGHGESDIVIIGESARIEASILARQVIIAGKLYGSIKALDLIYLKKKGSLEGLIYTNNFVIDNGGKFQGECISIQNWSNDEKNNFKLTPFVYSYQEYKKEIASLK